MERLKTRARLGLQGRSFEELDECPSRSGVRDRQIVIPGVTESHMIWCDPFAIEMHDRGDDRCASDKGGYEGCLIKSVLQHGHARVGSAEAREPWGGRPGVMGLRAQKDPVDRRGDLAGIHQCFHGKLCGRIGLFKGEFADSLSGTRR